jgi:small-conductance mechanosensitive channel
LTDENIVIIVPNSQFVSSRVINWTHMDPRVRFTIPVGVAYGSDPHLVEKLLLEVAAATPKVLKDPAPTVIFRKFGDNSLNFELRVWSAESDDAHGGLDSQINFAVWDKFRQHHIEIPFPQRDLHIKEPVKVEVQQT